MVDLYLRAVSADALAAALPWLRDEGGFWVLASDTFSFDPIGAIVTKDATTDENGKVTKPAEIDERFHANIRCTPEIAATIPPEFVINPATPGRVFAGDPPQAAPQAVVSMTVGALWDRLSDDEWDAIDAAMSKEHRRLSGLWNNTSHVMTEGDNLWTVIAGHLDAIVSAERKAELLAG